MRRAKNAREILGLAVGAALAPLVMLGTWMRGGRVAHPTGVVCAAEVVPLPQDSRLESLGQRLVGAAIVRFSGGFWRRIDAPEPLGCAVRFRGPRPLDVGTDLADQDLIFATRSLDQRDYLRHPYRAAGTFDAPGHQGVKLRLVPVSGIVHPGADRRERLLKTLREADASLRLELRDRGEREWRPVCEIRLRSELDLDQDRLGFSPWRTGQGIEPRGALDAIRTVVYAAGQVARRQEAS